MEAMRKAIAAWHGGNVTPEHPPKGESQANRKVENAGKTVRELIKIDRCQLEDHIGNIEDNAVIMQWMARWAAMAYNKFQQGHDGKTPFPRQTRRQCHSEVVPFGEKVLFKYLKKSGGRRTL